MTIPVAVVFFVLQEYILHTDQSALKEGRPSPGGADD
jgi:hypothetical protein